MKSLNLAICDDNNTELQGVAIFIKRYADEHSMICDTDCFSTGQDLLSSLESGKTYSMILMDIELKGENGIDISQAIRNKYGYETAIVFISGFPRYAINSIDVRPLKFLQKPFGYDEICDMMAAYYRDLEDRQPPLVLIYKDGYEHVINLRELLYVSSPPLRNASKEVIYHMKNDTFRTAETLNEVEDKLSELGFVRAHRSYLINLRCVKALNKNRAQIINKEELPIGRNYRDFFKRRFLEYVFSSIKS